MQNLVDEEAWGGNLLDILPQLLLLKDDIPVPNVTQPGAKHNISDQLISALAQVRKTKITTFLAHFEMAALHLRWLLDGGHVGANVVEELLKLDLYVHLFYVQLSHTQAIYQKYPKRKGSTSKPTCQIPLLALAAPLPGTPSLSTSLVFESESRWQQCALSQHDSGKQLSQT